MKHLKSSLAMLFYIFITLKVAYKSFKYMSVLRAFFFENNETAIFSFFQYDRVRTKNENGLKLIQKKIAARLSM